MARKQTVAKYKWCHACGCFHKVKTSKRRK